ncbi:MAG: pyridoxamine kinase [Acutalibacteraceae bacterium]
MQKKAAIVQDISCFGKCSTSVALPILAHKKIETAVLPTALLSAHTAFPKYTCTDLTENMKTTVSDWRELKLRFDGIFTGYMLNPGQIEITYDFIREFKKDNTLVLVDPVMGDDGKPYSLLSEKSAAGLSHLCSLADVITPNLTEAAMLLGKKPKINNYDEEYVRECLFELKALGCDIPMITGVSFEQDKIGSAFLIDGKMHYLSSKKKDGVTCGTGDTFSSVVFACMLSGETIESAVSAALRVVDKAIEECDTWYGIAFESALGEL